MIVTYLIPIFTYFSKNDVDITLVKLCISFMNLSLQGYKIKREEDRVEKFLISYDICSLRILKFVITNHN